MNKEELIIEINKLGINITKNQLQQIDNFCDFLIEFNTHTNLTSITNKESIYLKHVYDSLTILLIEDLNKNPSSIKNVLDIGSGAGFPGIILKIIFPNLYVTLLDSNNKKTKFLIEAIQKLGLENIFVVNQRAEEYINEKRNYYDLVTARAVAPTDILIELCLPFVKTNGFFIAMKGNTDITTENLSYIANILGGKINETKKFQLPLENSQRTLLKIVKKVPTPNLYPRAYNKIVKNPLKKTSK